MIGGRMSSGPTLRRTVRLRADADGRFGSTVQVVWVVWLVGPVCAIAQEPVRSTASPLSAKQEMIRDRISRLQDRMFRLRDDLMETEPESAEKLGTALDQMGRFGIQSSMDELVAMLSSTSRLGQAGDVQSELIDELRSVLSVLTEEAAAEDTRDRIEQLEAYRREIEQLIDRQQALRKVGAEAVGGERADGEDSEGMNDGSGADAERSPEDEARKIARLKELAEKQRSLEAEARDLARRMSGDDASEGQSDDAGSEGGDSGQDGKDEQSDQSGQSGGSQQGDGQQQGGQQQGGGQEPAPGQPNVEQAGRHMDKAGEQLDEGEQGGADAEQQHAIEELEQAKRDLEQDLQQLRKEQQQELLRDIEGRLAALLDGERTLHVDTQALDGRSVDESSRADRLAAAALASRQNELADDTARCVHILEEDGTTVAFPRVLEQVESDMRGVAERLARIKVGALTQALEEDIVNALSDLLEAVRRMQQENEQQQDAQQGQQGSEEQPLLPGSAELKLLRAAQVRIQQRTEAVHASTQAGDIDSDELSSAIEVLEGRQREVAGIAREMRERAERP